MGHSGIWSTVLWYY